MNNNMDFGVVIRMFFRADPFRGVVHNAVDVVFIGPADAAIARFKKAQDDHGVDWVIQDDVNVKKFAVADDDNVRFALVLGAPGMKGINIDKGGVVL